MTKFIFCEQCDYTWSPELPDHRRDHRNRHRRWATLGEPEPEPRLAALLPNAWLGDGCLVSVDCNSARWLNAAVYGRVLQFKRDFKYEFTQWPDPSDRRRRSLDAADKARGFVFIEGHAVIAGACAFRWRAYTNAPHGWAMDWIWLAPRFRRSGILTRAWPQFTSLFGNFWLEQPFSDAMLRFVNKIGHREPIERGAVLPIRNAVPPKPEWWVASLLADPNQSPMPIIPPLSATEAFT